MQLAPPPPAHATLSARLPGTTEFSQCLVSLLLLFGACDARGCFVMRQRETAMAVDGLGGYTADGRFQPQAVHYTQGSKT